jgi:hypothetical protein
MLPGMRLGLPRLDRALIQHFDTRADLIRRAIIRGIGRYVAILSKKLLVNPSVCIDSRACLVWIDALQNEFPLSYIYIKSSSIKK